MKGLRFFVLWGYEVMGLWLWRMYCDGSLDEGKYMAEALALSHGGGKIA